MTAISAGTLDLYFIEQVWKDSNVKSYQLLMCMQSLVTACIFRPYLFPW